MYVWLDKGPLLLRDGSARMVLTLRKRAAVIFDYGSFTTLAFVRPISFISGVLRTIRKFMPAHTHTHTHTRMCVTQPRHLPCYIPETQSSGQNKRCYFAYLRWLSPPPPFPPAMLTSSPRKAPFLPSIDVRAPPANYVRPAHHPVRRIDLSVSLRRGGGAHPLTPVSMRQLAGHTPAGVLRLKPTSDGAISYSLWHARILI